MLFLRGRSGRIDGFCVDGVVLLVGADKLHVDDLQLVRNGHGSASGWRSQIEMGTLKNSALLTNLICGRGFLVARNIVSLRESQDLFDDLTEDPAEWLLAQKVEGEVKPPPYRSRTPLIDRPFEDAEWFNAIAWPVKNWQASRFSDGTFGVWYGSESVETTVYESAYHWYKGLQCGAARLPKSKPQTSGSFDAVGSQVCWRKRCDFQPRCAV